MPKARTATLIDCHQTQFHSASRHRPKRGLGLQKGTLGHCKRWLKRNLLPTRRTRR